MPIFGPGPATNRRDRHELSLHRYDERFVGTRPIERQLDVSARHPLDQMDALFDRQVVGRGPVDLENAILRADIRHERWAALDRADDSDFAGRQFHRFNADAVELSFGPLIELLVLFGVVIGAVRVELAHHPVDRAADQGVVVRRFDVVMENLDMHVEQGAESAIQRIAPQQNLRHLPQQDSDDRADRDPDKVTFGHRVSRLPELALVLLWLSARAVRPVISVPFKTRAGWTL